MCYISRQLDELREDAALFHLVDVWSLFLAFTLYYTSRKKERYEIFYFFFVSLHRPLSAALKGFSFCTLLFCSCAVIFSAACCYSWFLYRYSASLGFSGARGKWWWWWWCGWVRLTIGKIQQKNIKYCPFKRFTVFPQVVKLPLPSHFSPPFAAPISGLHPVFFSLSLKAD